MQSLSLGTYDSLLAAAKSNFEAKNGATRFWGKDGSLWKDDEATRDFIPQFMGWIDCATAMKRDHLAEIESFVAEVKSDGFTQVVLAGMGGSSLAPFVFQSLFRGVSGLELLVLDSTHPADIEALTDQLDLESVLIIVASKSGTTAEPNAFNEYFWALMQNARGEDANKAMVVITDPNSKMQEMAESRGYRKVFLNYADIGGRYSALSLFGLVPAALMGVDVAEVLNLAENFALSHKEGGPAFDLGLTLGSLALNGRDKLTFITVPEHANLGLWMEQLVAESTGKEGKGILPIATELLGGPEVYGDDRVFAAITVGRDSSVELVLQVLEAAGHPVIRCQLESLLEIGAEMMRWEIATAAASVVLEINPFDQPNVQEAKDITKKYLKSYADSGSLGEQTASGVSEGYACYGEFGTITDFLDSIKPGDFLAILAYTASGDETIEQNLQEIRHAVRDGRKVATTLGYGPRYLHSTGQFHKGGPNTGAFLVVTHKPLPLELPGETIGFENFVQAQALGDTEALVKHSRRTLRVQILDETVLEDILREVEEYFSNQ